jgi:hypothetical protein
MAIKRYIADADNTITNALKSNLTTSGSLSNMGESDVLEVFSIYAQANSSSLELSRILTKFPVSDITTDRAAGSIPESGSVNFFLKLSNAVHTETTPTKFTLTVQPVSSSWEEGYGLDMEDYTDLGASNWVSSSTGTSWTSLGGDYLTSSTYDVYFANGTEDLEVDITGLVEQWASGTVQNYGVGIQLTASEESAARSYYTKKFFARGSEFFYKRPHIEARWDSSITDDRNNFIRSSSLLPADDNLNTLYLYNKFRGRFVNIPSVGTGSIYMSIYSGTTGPLGSRVPLQGGAYAVTGGYVSTGIYSASVAVSSSYKNIFDVWHNNDTTEFFTGSVINPVTYNASSDDDTGEYVINVVNLKKKYSRDEQVQFRMYARPKNWQPNIYTVAQNEIENTPIDKMYYRLFRTSDNYEVIPYGTGSTNHTKLSYDNKGNYFNFDMSLLQKDYEYTLKFLIEEYGEYTEQKEEFKFRVE